MATWIRLHYPSLHLVYSNTAARKNTWSSSDRRRASLHLKGPSLSPSLCLLPFWTRSESVRLSDGLWVCLHEVPFPCYSGGRAPSPPRRLSSPPLLPPSLLCRGSWPRSLSPGGGRRRSEVTSPSSPAPLAFQSLARAGGQSPRPHRPCAPPPSLCRRPRPCLSTTTPARTSRGLWTAVPRPTPRMTRPRRTCPGPRTTCGSP